MWCIMQGPNDAHFNLPSCDDAARPIYSVLASTIFSILCDPPNPCLILTIQASPTSSRMSTWELDRLESSLAAQEPSDVSAAPGAGFSTTSLITINTYVFP
jgi:hypothetical protein